jgi:hypothetical protein
MDPIRADLSEGARGIRRFGAIQEAGHAARFDCNLAQPTTSAVGITTASWPLSLSAEVDATAVSKQMSQVAAVAITSVRKREAPNSRQSRRNYSNHVGYNLEHVGRRALSR